MEEISEPRLEGTVQLQDGRSLGFAEYGTRNGVIANAPEGVSESDPTMWIAAVELTFERLRAAKVPLEAIRCVSVSGQQHGLVALDAEGGLARPRSKLWNDYSTAEECDLLTAAVGGADAMIREVVRRLRERDVAPEQDKLQGGWSAIRQELAEMGKVVEGYFCRHLPSAVKIQVPLGTCGFARALEPFVSGHCATAGSS